MKESKDEKKESVFKFKECLFEFIFILSIE